MGGWPAVQCDAAAALPVLATVGTRSYAATGRWRIWVLIYSCSRRSARLKVRAARLSHACAPCCCAEWHSLISKREKNLPQTQWRGVSVSINAHGNLQNKQQTHRVHLAGYSSDLCAAQNGVAHPPQNCINRAGCHDDREACVDQLALRKARGAAFQGQFSDCSRIPSLNQLASRALLQHAASHMLMQLCPSVLQVAGPVSRQSLKGALHIVTSFNTALRLMCLLRWSSALCRC